MRRTVALLSVATLLVLAGCTGAGQSGTPTSERPTSGPSATAESAVVAYDDLAPEAQSVFDRARERGSISGATGIDSAAVEPLFDAEFVVYEGQRYHVEADRELRPRTWFGGVGTVQQGALDRNRTVVTYANLSMDGRQAFDTVRNGSVSSVEYRPEAFPLPGEPISGPTGYVVYEGSYYELELAHADVYAYTFSVTAAEE